MFRYKMTHLDSMGQIKPWYYGFSYQEFELDLIVYHVIPINFIIRFLRRMGHLWNYARFRLPKYTILQRQNKQLKQNESRLYAEKNNIRNDILELTKAINRLDFVTIGLIIQKNGLGPELKKYISEQEMNESNISKRE